MSVYAYQADDGIAGDPALFFRASDRLRLEGYVAALTQNAMSLSMVSGHDALLDHYAKLLIARLREVAPQFELEVCFPASSEALIERFNQVLKAYSIEDAMATKVPTAPPKVWIVHDASALPDHEIQLLARLVQNFPGANIRIVMLLTQASQKQHLLNSFGRRFLNWDIEAPNPEQRAAMLTQAREQGREAQVNALLQQLGNEQAPVLQGPLNVAANNLTQQPQKIEQPPQKATWKRKPVKYLLAGFLLLAACSLVVGLWYSKTTLPELSLLVWEKISRPEIQSLAPAPEPAALQLAIPDETTQQAPAEASNQPEPRTIRPVEQILHTPAQAQAGQPWLLKMAAGTFVVVHLTESSFQEASFWLKSQPQLQLAQVLAHQPSSQPSLQFSVVSGPFTSITEARGFTLDPAIPKDGKVVSAQSMKEQVPSAAPIITRPKLEEKR